MLQALIKQHGGLPKDYKGAYEQFMEKKGANHLIVNSIQEASGFAQEILKEFVNAVHEPGCQEHAETVPVFAVVDPDEPVKLINHFKELAEQDPDDHGDLIEALKQFTPNVQIGPKQSQNHNKATKLSPSRIAAIAKKVNSGEIALPELDLPSDSDFVAVWALIDSGSSVHIVNAKKIFPGASNEPPPAGHKGFEVANGQRLQHQGYVSTTVRTVEGDVRTIR